MEMENGYCLMIPWPLECVAQRISVFIVYVFALLCLCHCFRTLIKIKFTLK